MKHFKESIVLLFLTFNFASACGGGWLNTYIKDDTYNFLDPSLVNLKEANPLYEIALSGAYGYNDRVSYFKKKSQQLNIEEWKSYFNNTLNQVQLQELFYGDKLSLKERYKKLSSKIDNPAFKKYIDFIIEQRPLANRYDSDVKVDAKKVLARGEKYLKEEKDAFLKLRYLFLVMRIAHYSGDYAKTLALYKSYYPKVEHIDSIVVEWIDALRAGALQHLGKDVASNLLYGKILKNSKTNAHLGYYDFKIKNDTEWKNLMSVLKTPDEKALFYFLRALKWKGVPVLEHREMAKIAPDSIWFDRLSYMIMQEFQNSHYSYELMIDKEDKYVQTNHQSYLEKKAFFLETLNGLKEPRFFSLYSTLYLHILEQEAEAKREEEVKRLMKLAKGKERQFVEMLTYLDGIRHVKKVEKGENRALFAQLSQLLKEAPVSKRESILGYTAFYMEKLYPEKSAEKLFSKLCSNVKGAYGCWGVESNLDQLRAKEFEHYVEKKERSGYEQVVFRLIMSSLAKNDVAKFLTLLHTKDGDFKKANHYLKQVPKLNRKTKFNPFNVSLSGNNRKVKGKGYGERKFVQTMLKIQETLKKNPTSAMDHYLYANGLYNSSWFGNFPMVASVDRSVTGFSHAEGEHILENFDAIEREYRLAEQYARNPEFKAKIAYQLLKIGYNRFLIEHEDEDYGVYVGYFKPKTLATSATFSKAIEAYKRVYGGTKYGKEIIKKCATFRYFR